MSAVSAQSGAPVGVFGGTFNPVHHGHLRSALELVEALGLEQLRLMPSAEPPHRDVPQCSAAHRSAMVRLAVAGESRLACDDRELKRQGKSYTIDSLGELRGELGADRSLCMVVGCDAVLQIESWHRWRELLDFAHIVVLARPGWRLPTSGALASWLEGHALPSAEILGARACGGILVQELRQLDISSTAIRQLLAKGLSPRYLLPGAVLDYIEQHGLYRD